MQIPTLIEILLARFNGQVLIPWADALSVIGYNRQTARNQLSRQTFPIRTLLQGSRRFIGISDLVAYIEGLPSDRQSSPSLAPQKTGGGGGQGETPAKTGTAAGRGRSL